MSKLNEIVAKLERAKQTASISLEQWDFRTRAGMEARKAKAQADIAVLTEKYREALFENSVKIFVNGPRERVAKFSELLKKEGPLGVFVEPIYESIALAVDPHLNTGRVFSAAAFLRLSEVVGSYARMLYVIPRYNLVEPKQMAVPTFEDLVAIVKDVVRNAFGDTLNKAYLANIFANEALRNKFEKPFAALIVSSVNDDEKATLIDTLLPGQPGFSVDLTEEEPNRSIALKAYRRTFDAFSRQGRPLPSKRSGSDETSKNEDKE